MSQCDDNQKSKKAIWFVVAIVIIIAIPFVLNALIQLPRFTEIVGGETDWLAFHGSYIGAIVGAGISFVIMYLTLKYYQKADNYRDKMAWLDDFRRMCVDFISAFNVSNVISIIDELPIDVSKSYKHCKEYMNQLMKEDVKLNLMVVDTEDKELMALYDDLRNYQMLYRSMLLNVLKIVLCVLKTRNNTEQSRYVNCKFLMDVIESDELRGAFKGSADIQGLVSIDCIHDVLSHWIIGFESIYKSMADCCVAYIGTKQREIKSANKMNS